MKAKKNKLIEWIGSSSSDVCLFLIFLILLNLVCVRAFFRIDMTSPRSYSLSRASKQAVKTLEEPLSVKVFFSKNLPSPYSSVEQYVNDILIEYKNASGKNFSCEYFDMNKTENQRLAQNYGLNQIQIREVKSTEVGFKSVFMGIVLTYADQIEVIDGIESSDGLEYTLTAAMNKIIYNTNIFAGLTENVTLTLYKSKELERFSINGIRDVEKVVEESFRSANKKFRGKIEFQTKYPATAESEELSRKYGISTVSWKNSDGTVEKGALGLILEMGDKIQPLPLEVQDMIFSYGVAGLDQVEESISAGIKALVSKTSKIAYATGHGELSLNDTERGAGNLESLLNDTYTLEEVNLSEKDIPVGIQNLVINGAKSTYTDDELYKIDQFVLRGGNLLVLADSFEEIMPEGQNMYYQQPQYVPVESGLEKILGKYGIELGKNYVMDESCYTQNNPQYGKMNMYFVPMMQKNSLDQKNPVSKNLGYVLFIQASSIDVSKAAENKDAKTTVLAKTSPKSWTMSENIVLSPMMLKAPADKSTEKSENVAVLVEGKFESAFTGKPSSAEKNADSGMESGNHISKSVQPSKIMVISTSQVTTPQLLQPNSKEPVSIFLRNAFDYMNGNEDFCTMRTKNLSLNTLIIRSEAVANAVKYFNEVGLALIVVAAGAMVLFARRKRREQIRLEYSKKSSQYISKNETEAKDEK